MPQHDNRRHPQHGGEHQHSHHFFNASHEGGASCTAEHRRADCLAAEATTAIAVRAFAPTLVWFPADPQVTRCCRRGGATCRHLAGHLVHGLILLARSSDIYGGHETMLSGNPETGHRQRWGVRMAGEAEDELVRALCSLRKGHGMNGAGLATFNDRTRELLKIDRRRTQQDQHAAIRRSILLGVDDVERNDPDAAANLRVALNLTRVKVRWQKRAEDAGRERGESAKTFIRHSNAAARLLAAAMAARAARGSGRPQKETVVLARLKQILERRDECRIVNADILILVRGANVEVQEVLEIEALVDDASYYVVGKTLPYDTTRVTTEVLSGAELEQVEQPNAHWLLELMSYTHPLRAGESHRVTIVHDTHDMAPMWTATNFHDVDSLNVTLRFMNKPYGKAFAIEDFLPKLLMSDDISGVLGEHAYRLDLNRVGEVNVRYSNLRYERSYGIGWEL